MKEDGTGLNITTLGAFLSKNQVGDWKTIIPKLVVACESVVSGKSRIVH